MSLLQAEQTQRTSHTITTLPCPTRRAKLKGLFLQVNNPLTSMQHLEEAVLNLGPERTIRFLLDVLDDNASTQKELQLAVMCLIRFGSRVREDVLRYAVHHQDSNRAWVVDFLVHQLGLKRAA